MYLCKGRNYNVAPMEFLIAAANNEPMFPALLRCHRSSSVTLLNIPYPWAIREPIDQGSSYLDNKWAQLFKAEAPGPDKSHKKPCLHGV